MCPRLWLIFLRKHPARISKRLLSWASETLHITRACNMYELRNGNWIFRPHLYIYTFSNVNDNFREELKAAYYTRTLKSSKVRLILNCINEFHKTDQRYTYTRSSPLCIYASAYKFTALYSLIVTALKLYSRKRGRTMRRPRRGNGNV